MNPSSTISAPAGASSPVSVPCQTRVRSPRSRPANSYSLKVSGTGATAARVVAGSAPIATSTGNGWPGCRSEEHTSELQSLMRISYAVFCLKKKKKHEDYIHRTSHKYTNSKERTENEEY